MEKRFLLGNEAIALAAIHSGIALASGYPGTPSTEIMEAIANNKPNGLYVEWSTNEKAALEIAAGASYCGARTIVTMKQVGLNVASDPLMSLAYVGVEGGMCIVVADDPGPISSQTEQDTRTFGAYSKLPVLDPSSPEEAYHMTIFAFELSEKIKRPVILRPTTRVCHAYKSFDVFDYNNTIKKGTFVKDTARWVIFPKASYLNHIALEELRFSLSDEFSKSSFNKHINNNQKIGIATNGISYAYVNEALNGSNAYNLLKIGTPYPFPEKLAIEFLSNVSEVFIFEELDPYIERELLIIAGKYNLNVKIHGKLDKTNSLAGENTPENIAKFLNIAETSNGLSIDIPLPVRPPSLCSGCPHRASFYAVKQAMKGKNAIFNGDIGCYTLGNAMPLNMVDTCLCMGADITLAQGINKVDESAICFSFIGDSTFFASGLTGIVNAVYNKANITIIVLDNSTTAMTGNQPHPGIPFTLSGDVAKAISIPKVLEAVGLDEVITLSPFEQDKAIEAVKEISAKQGVKAIIFKAPCVFLSKAKAPYYINEKCIKCNKCIREIGCPAIAFKNDKVVIDEDMCNGCGLCKGLCPVKAINQREV
ncbi:MAG: indolepyruvate ferredoxin oxidoreductase subunit alpha [Christensenellaceae bacterium]|nr:indolepyruvate ferredoxin oxidoreductase subunit alpha [Christensenellaceae bacterium]